MKLSDVTMVRIYLTEANHLMKQLLERLHDEERVRGVTVFRGITGFGKSGKMHSSSLLDLSLDLPVIIEFFDDPDKVEGILHHLKDILPAGHVVTWPAKVNTDEEVSRQ
jgi:PII-like signaling protein